MMISNLPKWFRELPSGQEAVEQHEQAEHEQRQALATEVAEIEKAFEANLPEKLKRLELARRAWHHTQRKVRDAETEYFNQKHELAGETAARDSKIGNLKRQLADSASPRIDRFADELNRLLEETRSTEVVTIEETNRKFSMHTGRYRADRRSNYSSIKARTLAIIGAKKSLAELRLEPLIDAELDARFAAIVDGLPAIEQPK